MTANGFSSECRDVSPETIIGRIRAGRWRQKIEKLRTSYAAAIAQGQDAKKAVSARKKALPGVLWSGRFSRRANEGLLEHSGLLCGDLDHLGSHMAQIRAILLASPYLWALFTSPTGTGLKVVFRVEADPAQHAASFKAVQEHVRELVQVGIDVACSDVARLCFVSYDPDAILNSAAQVLAPCTELAKDHPRSVLCPQVSAAVRQQIAAELLGPVDWASETSGFCACPGRDLHTNANGPRDCKIHIDGVPTLHCFHSSCRSAVEQANHELRSRIGKAELRSSVSRPAGSTCERETTSDEQAFTRLAALSPADYDRNRAAEAQQLGIRAATLDTEVARRRPQADRAQRTSVDFPTAEPWPEAVHGAQILNDLADTFTRYLALPTGAKDALALWTAHTHCFEAFLHTPRLNLHSPEKGCGKTTLLDLLASLVLRPLRTESITPAVLFRLVELRKPTLLLDEVDTYLPDHDELRGLLNAGHKRGAKAYRCEGDRNEVRGFAAFAPAALAGIGNLPGTLHDRSIIIRLVRAKPGEVSARFDSRRTQAEAELCGKLTRWGMDNASALEKCDPILPSDMFNRIADNWRPLFAIAAVAGGDWPTRAAEAFRSLTATDDIEAHGIGVWLLSDIRAQFTAANTDRFSSGDLVEALHQIDGRPWAEFGKARRAISTNQLASLLRRFGVSSRGIRVGNHTPRGYILGDFADAFDRYLPPSPNLECNSATTPADIGDSRPVQPQQLSGLLQSQTMTSTTIDSGCCTVAAPKPDPSMDALNPEVLNV